jgi:hypothetical protein
MESTTQERSNTIIENSEIIESSLKEDLKTYLLGPLYAGLVGFAIFFSLIFFTKFFSYIFGINESFSFGISDVIYSLLGFLFVTGARFLEFFGKED